MRRLLITTVLAISAVTLAGCSFAGSGSDASLQSADGGATQYLPSAPDSKLGIPTEGGDLVVGGPQIITTVQLTVTVKAPGESADEAAKIVAKAGGTVSDRSETAPSKSNPGSAQLTLRIPSSKVDATLDALKALGTARDTTINSTDVTAQSQDLDARITALQASVDRLLDLMSKATTTQDLITIESALSERQANLEGLQSQKRYLDDQVQLSTVSLYLISEQDTPADTPDNFWTGLVAGWGAFVAFLSGALVVIGVLIPWMLSAGLIAAIVLVWVRLAKRHSAKKLEQPPAS